MGPAATGIPFSAPIRIMLEPDCSVTQAETAYLTADSWLSRKSYEEFLALRRSEYDTLDAATEELTLSERHIGSLETDAP
jgi:hypothetical protein